MADPKFDQSDFAPKRGRSSPGFGRCSMFLAPILAVESMFEVPARSTGSRKDFEHRLCGDRRRRKNSLLQRRGSDITTDGSSMLVVKRACQERPHPAFMAHLDRKKVHYIVQ